jgi:imidazolonepropionase-like amidohydrolase
MHRAFTAVLVIIALACKSSPQPPPPVAPSRALVLSPSAFALAHTTVVDVAGGVELRDRTVVVDGDRIAAVLEGDAPPGAKVIDARDKWIIPGLWDMHVHFADPNSATLFVANGVTGVRVMWGNPQFGPGPERIHDDLRDAIAQGKRIGPRMIIASNIMDGPKPTWPKSLALATADEGRKAVDDAKASGADFIKVYSGLPRDVFYAIAEQSRHHHLPFAGHVPEAVTVAEASDAGQHSIEHLTGMATACSSHEDELMRKRAELASAGKRTRETNLAEVAAARASYDDAKAKALFAKFKANDTWMCPTFTVLHSIATLDDPNHADDPRLKYVSPFIRQFWDPKQDFRFKTATESDFAAMRAGFDSSLALVGKMAAADVPMLAGTDEMNPFVFAGFSLHDELGWLVKAGLTPAQALRAATIGPARYLGLDKTMGTVEVDRVADLVVLDGDPLADIANTMKIHAVVARGKHYDRAALDKLLADVEETAKHASSGP